MMREREGGKGEHRIRARGGARRTRLATLFRRRHRAGTEEVGNQRFEGDEALLLCERLVLGHLKQERVRREALVAGRRGAELSLELGDPGFGDATQLPDLTLQL